MASPQKAEGAVQLGGFGLKVLIVQREVANGFGQGQQGGYPSPKGGEVHQAPAP